MENINSTALKPESIYIHIPFCKTKCPYCDFASWAKKEDLFDRYFNALLFEIRSKCEVYKNLNVTCHCEPNKMRRGNPQNAMKIASPLARNDMPSPIKTIFIGGGTPSLLPPEYYEKLFVELKKIFTIEKNCEITLELNPGTAREDFLCGYRKLGINRISIGAQSFNEKILQTLGRGHSVAETIDAINLVKSIGFTNLNLDLIYAVPGMTYEVWIESIQKALEYKPNHISAYSLTIESGTPFEHKYKDKKNLPKDDFTYSLYTELCNILKSNGYVHYEVSNFAKTGFESKHNLTYWLGKEYYAFGVGAHRFLNGLRSCNTRELEKYIMHPNTEKIIDYPIDYNFEKIMLSSRLTSGFEVGLIEKVTTKSNFEIKNLLHDLSKEGFLELSKDKIHLTDKGLFVNNEILLKLI